MNKQGEKLMLAFAIVGVLIIGSAMVYATFASFETEDDDYNDGTTSLGAAVYTVGSDGTITEQEAIAIAKKVASGSVTDIALKQKKSDSSYIYYDIEFESSSYETEIRVHAVTGEVLSNKREGKDAVDASSVKISESQARSIAQDAVKSGTVTSVELENENGKAVYEVDLRYSDGRKVEVEIDASSGEVLEIGFADGDAPAGFADGGISRDEAKQIAENRLSSGYDFEEIESGYYRGTKVWEVEYEKGSKEAEVIIDLNTGEILKVEYEDEDDDDDD